MRTKILAIIILLTTTITAQVGINTTTPNAQLDIQSSNQSNPSNTDGVLIPKIDLFPAINPTAAQHGMLVYLTTTTGGYVRGFYYWDNDSVSWLPIKEARGGTLDEAYDFGGAGAGRIITADAGAVQIAGTDGLEVTGAFNSGAALSLSGAGTRMFFYPRKAAFRAGYVVGTQWNNANIGNYSTAWGYNTIALGNGSTAWGANTEASENNSTAWGANTEASGRYSTAWGLSTTASNLYSTAWGNSTTASGSTSTAWGLITTASGSYSTAWGLGTTASGSYSTAWGNNTAASGSYSTASGSNTTASGNYAIAEGQNSTASGTGAKVRGNISIASGNYSTAWGYNVSATQAYATAWGYASIASGDASTVWGYANTASGNYSTAFGFSNQAQSYLETVLGRYAIVSSGNPSSWAGSEPLFVIGNGTTSIVRSNALTILKNGRIGLQNILAPAYALQLPNNNLNGIGRGQANSWNTYSDGRLKTNRNTLSYGLKEIMQIEPLAYFHHNSSVEDDLLIIHEDGEEQIGFIAQDMYQIIPEIVGVPENETKELWGISYEKLTPVLVKAIQEQQAIIEKQQTIIENLQNEKQQIQNFVSNLEVRLNTLENQSERYAIENRE
ncbi:MAG: tail fiber domain-containing protein [Flavobacteriaceae bacterium]|jgi:hypothetical protein|nr:tail fiber domain-containing protein [Flavobacteriaceae bacterium]